GDFAIDRGFRSLGPAMLLQRATLTPVLQGEMAFCYDCPPDHHGMSTFKRMGIPACGRMQRFAKPLKVDRQGEAGVGNRILARGLTAAANKLLALRRPPRGDNQNIVIAVHQGGFTDEFSRLDARVEPQYKVRSQRTAAYLNWRYRDNPLYRYEVVTAR